MGLSKQTLKGMIEYSDLRNEAGLYNEDDVIGVSTNKDMIPTKANLDGVNLLNYKIFPPKSFAYVADTSRRGDKIALTYNNTKKTYIVSTWYVVFHLSEEAKNVLMPEYLFLFFNRSEFDRYARTNSWGSAREYFWFEDMEDVMITLPSIEQQRKYVDVYLSLQNNLATYQSKVDDLKLVCDGYLDQLKESCKKVRIGELLAEVDCRNTDSMIKIVKGINIEKKFMNSVADNNGVDLSKYKVVHGNEFAFSGMQTGRDECIRIALNQEQKPIIVSPAYTVLKNKKKDVLNIYILLWFSRKEIDRYGWFASDASIRSNLDLDRFYEMQVPLPSIDIQKNIVKLFCCYIERQRIAAQLKEQLNNLCPILIKGSLETWK